MKRNLYNLEIIKILSERGPGTLGAEMTQTLYAHMNKIKNKK
jgi:hypothetical protein